MSDNEDKVGVWKQFLERAQCLFTDSSCEAEHVSPAAPLNAKQPVVCMEKCVD